MKILLISGMQTIRANLKQLLVAQPDVEIVKETEDNLSSLQVIKDYAFDVAVTDLLVPLRTFTETIRRMLSIKPNLRIIALSMYSDRRYLDQCLQAGVCGYLLKDCAYEDLADATRTVASGRQYVSSSIDKHAVLEARTPLLSKNKVGDGSKIRESLIYRRGGGTKIPKI